MHLFKYPWLFGKIIALTFIFFGGGVLAVVLVPVILLVRSNKEERTQNLIRYIFRFYLWALTASNMIQLVVEKVDDFKDCSGKIIVANHPTLLDVVILMAYIPRVQCIVKSDLWNHFFLGGLMRSAGYIRNDLSPDKIIKNCQKALDGGRCLLVFPEGTRRNPNQELKFQRGFANIAFYTKRQIQTVIITCNPLILYKGEPLFSAPERCPVLRVRMGNCLDKDFYLRYDCRGIAVRKIVKKIESYYRKIL